MTQGSNLARVNYDIMLGIHQSTGKQVFISMSLVNEVVLTCFFAFRSDNVT